MSRYNPKAIEPKWQKIWDETGIYTTDLKSNKLNPNFYVIFSKDDDTMNSKDRHYLYGNNPQKPRPFTRTNLFTDRAIYRPGQTVYFKGIVIEKDGEQLAILGVENWTTSYRGNVGSLDYNMVNKALAQKATGVTQWHINADEIRHFGYRTSPLTDGIDRPQSFYQASPFSSSDHDPVMAGFELTLKSGSNN